MTTPLNKVLDEIFNLDGAAARLTVVVIYNHTDTPIFFIDFSFDTGGFTPGEQAPFQIDPMTANGYRVKSHGIGTGVTGAHIRYGLAAGDASSLVLDITISNPFAGDNSSDAQGMNGFGATHTDFNRQRQSGRRRCLRIKPMTDRPTCSRNDRYGPDCGPSRGGSCRALSADFVL